MMITLKKIRSLKPRVQLRKAADVFHEANMEETEDGYLESVLDIILSSDLVSEADGDKLRSYFSKGRGVGYEDIYYNVLAILGDSPSDWDKRNEEGDVDWSMRHTLEHALFLDHLRSPYNVGAIFRNAEAFCVNEIILAPGTASPMHPRAERTSRGTVEAIPWREGEISSLRSDVVVFALETGGTDIREFRFPEKGVCVIGSEETGITKEARERAENDGGIVTIPQFGAKGSINVASAAAILLYKWIEVLGNQPLS